MTFGSIELARRIDLAAGEMLRAVERATPGTLTIHELGDGAVGAIASADSPFQKVIGWGWGDEAEQREALEALERAAAERGTSVPVELSVLADAGRAAMLEARGYTIAGFENVLGRALSSADEGSSAPAITIERVAAHDEELFLETMLDAFATPDGEGIPSHESFPREPIARAMRAMARPSAHRRYLARLDGVVAGAGSLWIGEGVAQLSGAATLPAFRRRGVQTALLAARLREARAAGCELATITTQPGSRSQRNAQERGFSLLTTRVIFVRRS